MKKLLSLLFIGCIAISTSAQDKKFQIGLVTGGTFNWIKTQTVEIERNGIGGGFTIGVGGNYLFSDNVGLASGVQFDIESFNVNYGSMVTASTPSGRVYYGYDDTEILRYDDDANTFKDLADSSNILELQTRKFKAKYVTIPFFLKFQTNMIGQFKYYGKFGLRTSILAGVRFDDIGYAAEIEAVTGNYVRTGTATHSLNQDMKPSTALKGLTPIRMGIGIYGGAEWNFTGNTYLYLEGGFNYGIIPSMQIKSGHLSNQISDSVSPALYENGTMTTEKLDIKNNPQHVIEIKLGLLF